MKKITILLLLCIFTAMNLSGQSIMPNDHLPNFEKCGTDYFAQKAIAENPNLLLEKAKVLEQYEKYKAKHAGKLAKMDEILTIPVVVHIVHYPGNPDSNISDEQILSQIEELNRVYRANNANFGDTDPAFTDVAADCEIEFCLAQLDPNGNPTNGITRTSSDIADWEDDQMKSAATGGIDAWPANKYLNIWVCNSLRGGEVLGYAYLPGDAPSLGADGLAIAYYVFGTTGELYPPYTLGRTAVHEIGHWLNLYHPWGPGNEDASCFVDDGISDTPLTAEPNFGCPTFSNQCSNESPDLQDMIQNYMDYTNDACQTLFTLEQKTMMRSVISPGGYRTFLIQNPINPCQAPEQGANNVVAQDILYPTGINNCSTVSPIIEVYNFGTSTLTYFVISYVIDDGEPIELYWTGEVPSLGTLEYTLPPINAITDDPVHTLTVTLSSPNGVADAIPTDNSMNVVFGTIAPGLAMPVSEDFETGNFSTAGWVIENADDDIGFEITDDASNTGTYAATINNFNYDASGEIDELIMPAVNISGPNPSLVFDAAYALKTSGDALDNLAILISIDCGESFNLITTISSADLGNNTTPTSTNFIPTLQDWKNHSISLADYIGVRNANIMFRQIRGEGNNVYLDNISVDPDPTSVETNLAPLTASFSMYPNPTTNNTSLYINTSLFTTNQIQLNVINTKGQLVYHKTHELTSNNTSQQLPLYTQNLPAGIYLVHLQDGLNTFSKKLVIIK